MNAPASHLAQAASLMGEGRFEDARALLMRHARGRVHPHTYHLLAIASETLGEPERAMYFAQRAAAAADPNDSDLVLGYSQRLFVAGRTRRGSSRCWTSTAAARPAHPGVLSARIGLLNKLGREEEAAELARNAPEQMRVHPQVAETLGVTLQKLGRLDEALELCRKAGRALGVAGVIVARDGAGEGARELADICSRFPDDESAWTYYASTLNYVDGAELEESLRAHKAYARAARLRLGQPYRVFGGVPDPERKLRIGIVSPDLRRHAIVSFLAPLLEGYDRSEWHVTAYSTNRVQDDVSARLKTLVDAWRLVPGGAHHAPWRGRIHEDKIDVAIELSGHTEEHKLDAMHLRPAPVQMTYLGYPNTTGLDTIDVRIVDSITDPPGSERWAVEKLARIDPCFLCFKPIDDAPELAPPPSRGFRWRNYRVRLVQLAQEDQPAHAGDVGAAARGGS